MVLLPEEAEMTLAELRQMAARQQHQIEAQQQLLIAKEQRLKFLKQQEARHHHLAELKVDPKCLQSLRERVEAQELKLRHLKALHGQVEQQRTNNCNLGAELESIRALFSEKEKELNVAVSKVEDLMRQLDEIKSFKNQKTEPVSPLVSQLENMKRELMYRNKVVEDQNNYIFEQRELISQRQQDISELDSKIAELTQRLKRKKLMNQQLANQIHNTSVNKHPVNSPHPKFYLNSNVATVEPIQRETQDLEQTRDDLAAKLTGQGDLSEFSLKKNDPKYQTLPYNTKFTLKGKTSSDDSPVSSEDVPDCASNLSIVHPVQMPSHGIANFAPRPFISNANHSSATQMHISDKNLNSESLASASEAFKRENKTDFIDGSSSLENKPKVMLKPFTPAPDAHVRAKVQKEKTVTSKTSTAKPVVPPKPTLPVKPIPPPRQTPSKDRPNGEERNDAVSAALSILQNKSKDRSISNNYRERLLYYRCVSRYSLPNSAEAEPLSSESKLTTYFSKPSEYKSQDVIRRKTAAGQLPIKPKPLTIRKTPGLEPPKLKTSQNSSAASSKKVQDSIYSTALKPTVPPPPPPPESFQKEDIAESKGRADNIESHSSSVPKLNAISNQFSSMSISSHNGGHDSEPFDSLEMEMEENDQKREDESRFKGYEPVEDDSSSPCDSLENMPVQVSPDVLKNEVLSSESSAVHPSAAFRRMKGNLKTENSVKSPRRVSFDPLALLLDAALEGELELVKKTACEVANPSAANDEGITALHNAICAGHFEVVTFLVDFGCDVNAQDSDGWTPLHCAASCNNLPMVKFLVERGACIFATTLSDHETAAEKCEEEEEGFDGCSEYLYGLQENMGIMNSGIVYAVYDYKGLNADELSFKDGDSITVLRNGDDQESEWWWSKLNDEEGYVPRNLLGLYPRITSKKD